jgi:GrpB-like predicted nucleotidyltransferase (UPF0157 family)
VTESESLERAIHEEVALMPYDPQWLLLFAKERERLMHLFPSRLLDVQHFGSTAIPGMPAKPIIDLLAGVESMAIADSLVEPLLRSGYTTSAEFNATLPDRRWFMRWSNGHRTHHLHVVVLGGPEWRRRLRFRDALRSNAELAQRYAILKQQLAAQHGADREAYTHAKSEFVRAIASDA